MPDKILSGRQSNCLNTIRLLAALQVVYDHVITHLSVSVPGITETVFGYFQGVPVFFIISGFLIWQSAGNSKSYKTYLKKRFLRIYPELWVAVFVEIVVILAAYRDYILKQLLLFAVGQASILQFWTPDSLRGYGCGTPNGSLWTIGVLI